MIRAVRSYIEKHRLLEINSPVLVGFSGGADSVALLAILKRLGYSCIALHCNFHLRGEESERDEEFARQFACGLGIPFHKKDFPTEEYAREKHLSIEMAARELRYHWFEEMRESLHAQAIAIAHHQDDSIETLLINLVRGTGIRGLRGIQPHNGYVVRPLLPVSREDILKWLEEEGYHYITDSTNLSDIYTRNFIRLRILPLLEELNPSVRCTIARTAANLSDVESLYDYVIEEAKGNIFIDDFRLSIPKLRSYPASETVLYELLLPYGFNRIMVEEIYSSLTKTSGKIFFSKDYRLLKDRDYLILSLLSEKRDDESYTIASENDFKNLPIELSTDKIVLNEDYKIEKDKHIASFDYEKIKFPLTLRHWKEGDWFIPFGMTGKKKLSDYFSDHKFTRIEKENVWLLCSGDDILWITGERIDNRFCIQKTSKQAFIVKKMV